MVDEDSYGMPTGIEILQGLSLGSSACLVLTGVRRRSIGGLVLAIIGGGLAWWVIAMRGSNRTKTRVASKSIEPQSTAGLGPWEGQIRMPEAGEEWHWSRDDDEVDQASMDSFPASDSPSSNGTILAQCDETASHKTRLICE